MSEDNENVVVVVKQKRGRKPKNTLLNVNNEVEVKKKSVKQKENVVVVQDKDENKDKNLNNEVKQVLSFDSLNIISNSNIDENNSFISNVVENCILTNNEVGPTQIQGPMKKRGRKPKGGKIIQQIVVNTNNNVNTKPSVILHLKCFLKELETNILNSNIESYHFSNNKNDLSYEIIDVPVSSFENNTKKINNKHNNNEDEIEFDNSYNSSNNKENDTKEIWRKLKQLEHNLHTNNINNKKSACFWCTCDFDNPPVYIPKHFIKNSYHVYGCFCSPECGVAFLMEENIDSSSKFERYYLMNHIYSKIYDYKQNIKPSPNPYYMLDKYYGNLSIQEYRALLRNERLFLIIEKPLTRIMPELHEDNDDFIINNKIIPSNNYQIKKKLQKKEQGKSGIFNDSFGMV